jgi:threonine/homoserine/homoserine lactone efflux protein
MLIPGPDLLLFAAACVVLVITPGPNMIYLLSRAICQGRSAGVVSLAGVIVGFFVHMLAAAIGLSAVFIVVPLAFDLLKYLGAAYLLWMAWEAVRPGGRSPVEPRALPPESARALFVKGFLTNVLNPKVAMFYLALFPQFVDPGRGSVLLQSLTLGGVQIAISIAFDLWLVVAAAAVARWFASHPLWLAVQRWVMGGMLAALAVRIALEPRPAG